MAPYKMESVPHILLISGGIDSVVLAYWASNNQAEIREALFVNYGQDPLSRELYSARRTCLALNIPLHVVDLSGTRNLFWGIIKQDYHVFMAEAGPLGNHCNDGLIAYSIAALYAVIKGVPRLLLGVQGDDAERGGNFPLFKEHFEKAISAQHEIDFKLVTPFMHTSKVDILKIGQSLNVPWDETWACHTSGYVHCGTCGGCQRRKTAFMAAAVVDTLKYQAK